METNYTPLNLKKFEENNQTTTFLLVLATISLTILAIVLFLFIQKKIEEQKSLENNLNQIITITPTSIPSPTEIIIPSETPTPLLEESSNESSSSPIISITPEVTSLPSTNEASPVESQ